MIESSVPVASVMGLEHHQPTVSTVWGHGGCSKINNKNGVYSGMIQAMRTSQYFSVNYIGDKMHKTPIFHQQLIPVSALSVGKVGNQHNHYIW